jgi:hypothetical protein
MVRLASFALRRTTLSSLSLLTGIVSRPMPTRNNERYAPSPPSHSDNRIVKSLGENPSLAQWRVAGKPPRHGYRANQPPFSHIGCGRGSTTCRILDMHFRPAMLRVLSDVEENRFSHPPSTAKNLCRWPRPKTSTSIDSNRLLKPCLPWISPAWVYGHPVLTHH